MNKEQPSSVEHLTTEARNPASMAIDSLSALDIVRVMNHEDEQVTAAVRAISEAIAQAVDVIADRLSGEGRLIYMGAGTSGRLGVLDASECPPTFNTPPELVIGLIAGGYQALTRSIEGAEDHPEFGRCDLEQIGVNDRDVVVGIATSGRTPYVIGGMRFANEVGAFTIGFSCNDSCELSQHAQLMLNPIVGPEVISGSTRLKAGTATKLVLNMLTTGAMIRLGKTYGNLMVDLRATNSKLKLRSRRIVSEITGLDSPAAISLLERCDGDVKTAIVTQVLSTTPDKARQLLKDTNGHLRQAINGELNHDV